jgi:hypothetical protein
MNKFVIGNNFNNLNSLSAVQENGISLNNLSSQKIVFNATNKSSSLNLNNSEQQQFLLQHQQVVEEVAGLRNKLD